MKSLKKPTSNQEQQPAKTKNEDNYLVPVRPCVSCGLSVWCGKEKDAGSMQLAFPRGTRWDITSAQPYCQVHWDEESEMLEGLAEEQHCGKGVSTKKGKAKKKTEDKKSKPKKKTKKKKKTTTEIQTNSHQ